MTDQQLYLAIGLPITAFLLGALVNILVIMWQAKATERILSARIDGLERLMDARFNAMAEGMLRVEQVLDARLKHLEER
ncbi:MAG: hypothetical protein M3Y72_05850 [Acidobacteriota bacterium]|nr:hypothetical protein [Acidobacteriota bacterium]